MRKVLLLSIALLAACADDSSLEVENQQANVEQSTSTQADIYGQVVNSNGDPIAGAVVATTPYGRSFQTANDSRRLIETFTTDSDGNFRLPLQALGSYNLKAMASSYQIGIRTVANIDFLPQNLTANGIVKNFVLQDAANETGSTPAIALFDIEDKKRMTEFLTSHNIQWQSVVGQISTLSKTQFNTLVIGSDATVYNAINELIDQQSALAQFIAAGGHVVFGQQNDFSFEGRRLTFLAGNQSFQLHTENAPFNDFFSAVVLENAHPLVDGVAFSNWNFIEPGQKQLKQNIVFDAAIASSFQGAAWQLIVRTPAETFSNAQGIVLAQEDVVIAEYIDPISQAHIVVNQAAYYQGAFGDLTDQNAVRLTRNMASYIRQLNSTP